MPHQVVAVFDGADDVARIVRAALETVLDIRISGTSDASVALNAVGAPPKIAAVWRCS